MFNVVLGKGYVCITIQTPTCMLIKLISWIKPSKNYTGDSNSNTFFPADTALKYMFDNIWHQLFSYWDITEFRGYWFELLKLN